MWGDVLVRKMYVWWGRCILWGQCTGTKNNILNFLNSHQDERVNIYAPNIANLLKKIINSDLDSLIGAEFL